MGRLEEKKRLQSKKRSLRKFCSSLLMAALSFSLSLSLSLSFSFTLSRFFFHFFSSKVKVLKFECVCAHPSANKRCRPIGLSGIKSDRWHCSGSSSSGHDRQSRYERSLNSLLSSIATPPFLQCYNGFFLDCKEIFFLCPSHSFSPTHARTHTHTHTLIFTTPHLNMRPCWIFQVCGDLLLITHPSANCPPPPPTRTTLSVT